MSALDQGPYAHTLPRLHRRPGQQRIGARRDQYGNVLPTPNAIPGGGLSRAHDWSAFDRAFATPAPAAAAATPAPATDAQVPANAARTAGAVAATAMGNPMAALPATIQPPTAAPVTVAQPPAITGTRHERIVADPNDWRGKTGVANPPPARNLNNTVAEKRVVSMKPIPKPLTSPEGNRSTDAANLAQNRAMYAPGGMSETAYQRDTRVAAGNAIPANVTAAAGTGQNVAGEYGTAYSTPNVNTIPQKSVAGVSPAGARNDINTGGNVLATPPVVAPAPAVVPAAAPVAAVPAPSVVTKPAPMDAVPFAVPAAPADAGLGTTAITGGAKALGNAVLSAYSKMSPSGSPTASQAPAPKPTAPRVTAEAPMAGAPETAYDRRKKFLSMR